VSTSAIPAAYTVLTTQVGILLPANTSAAACNATVMATVLATVLSAAAAATAVSVTGITCTLTTATMTARLRARALQVGVAVPAVVYTVSLTVPPTSNVQDAYNGLAALSAASFGSTTAALAAATGLAQSAFVVALVNSQASCGGGGLTCPLPSTTPSPEPSNVGAIVGGVVGGLAGVALIATFIIAYRTGYFSRRRSGALVGGTPSAGAPFQSPAAGGGGGGPPGGGGGPRGNIVSLDMYNARNTEGT
jgi:hypothetical protein